MRGANAQQLIRANLQKLINRLVLVATYHSNQ